MSANSRPTTSSGKPRKRKTSTRGKRKASPSLMSLLKEHVRSGRARTVLGCLAIVVVVLSLFALVSHTFATMPEAVLDEATGEMTSPKAFNVFGLGGYAFARWLFDGSFGLGVFVVMGYLAVQCLVLLRVLQYSLGKHLRLIGYTAFWSAWVATLSAWLMGADELHLWGGRIGQWLCDTLVREVHVAGLVVLLVLSLFLVLLFVWDGLFEAIKARGTGEQPQWLMRARLLIGSDVREVSRTLTLGRLRMAVGMVLSVVTFGVGASVLSHLFTAGRDQAFIHAVGDAASSEVSNLLGPVGARVGDLLFNQYLGVGVFLQIAFFGLLSLVLLRLKRGGLYRMLRYFALSTFWAVWVAVVAALIDLWIGTDSPLLWGGRQGSVIAETLHASVYTLGAVLCVLVVGGLLGLLSSERVYNLIPGRDEEPEAEEPAEAVETPQPDERTGLWSKLSAFFTFPKRQRTASDEGEEADDEEAGNEPTLDSSVPDPSEMPAPVASAPAPVIPVTPKPREAVAPSPAPAQPAAMQATSQPKPEGVEAPRRIIPGGMPPPLDLLREYETGNKGQSPEEVQANGQRIIDTLDNFKIRVTPGGAPIIGPTVTLYEVIPDAGVKISRIKSLENDLALALKSEGIRIIAPMPGAGTVGIEVPNSTPDTVSMRGVLESPEFAKAKKAMELPVGIGRTITNAPFIFDMAKMPHLLIAGATGQGKSVGLNALITSLLYSKTPDQLKFVLIDPKMLEFSVYSRIERHFLIKLQDSDKAIITDMARVVPTLTSLCVEMDNRYRLLTEANVRNIKDYNTLYPETPMPYIVVIVDEFADLIMTSGKDVVQPIARLAQKARAAGIHMVIATQRPSTDVITGLIKANFPARIAFKVFSSIDSRTILDSTGANKLIGRGDMLFYQGRDAERVQCAFMDTPETVAIVDYIAQQPEPAEHLVLPDAPNDNDGAGGGDGFSPGDRLDSMLAEVAEFVVTSGSGSTSSIQRRYNIGYNRAGRLMDQLEAIGIVGPQQGSKPREVRVKDLIELSERLSQYS